MAASNRALEAKQLWNWIQPRLPPAVWLECQQILTDPTPPPLTDPELVQGLATLLDPATTNPQRVALLRQLLTIIRNAR
jgi:hypothetical protein